MDVDSVIKATYGMAVKERIEHNKGKGHRSKDWETWAETRQRAAEYALATLVYLAIMTAIAKAIKTFAKWAIRKFGIKMGSVIIALCAVIPLTMLAIIFIAEPTTAQTTTAKERRVAAERHAFNQELEAYRIGVREKFNALKNDFIAQAKITGQDEAFTTYAASEIEKTFNKGIVLGGVHFSSIDDAKKHIDYALESCEKEAKGYGWYKTENERKVSDYLNKSLSRIALVAEKAKSILQHKRRDEKVVIVEHTVSEVELRIGHQLIGKTFAEAKAIIDKNTDAAIAEINKTVGKPVEAVLREAQDEDDKEDVRQFDGESAVPTENLRQDEFASSEQGEGVNVQNQSPKNVCPIVLDVKQYLADHTKVVKQLAEEIKKDVGDGEYYSTIMADSVVDNYERQLNGFVMEGTEDLVKARIDKAYNECVNTLSNRWLKAKGN